MELVRYVRDGRWATVFGYGLFIGMMATGYYYNVTFVQLGLEDLGLRLIGMSEPQVATGMGLLALLACVAAVGVGLLMTSQGWSEQFAIKLRLGFGVVLVQTVLTAIAPFLRQQAWFLIWIAVAAVALGVGMPATFSLTVDLIPMRDRGYVAACITALAYLAAPVLSSTWRIESFALQMLLVMPVGAIALGILSFGRFYFIEELAKQHQDPAFGLGRFVPINKRVAPTVRRKLLGFILLMFGVYFIDSLGFLRLIHTPLYVESAWLSPELSTRLFIGSTHVVAALVAGALYYALDERALFYWIFGLFALVHLMYTFPAPFNTGGGVTLAEPMLYSIAVSLYTVVNFAVWTDLSTPRTIGLNSALGVALSGFGATFLSTALAIQWRVGGMPVERHLSIVDALAMLFFVGLLGVAFLGIRPLAARSRRPSQRRLS